MEVRWVRIAYVKHNVIDFDWDVDPPTCGSHKHLNQEFDVVHLEDIEDYILNVDIEFSDKMNGSKKFINLKSFQGKNVQIKWPRAIVHRLIVFFTKKLWYHVSLSQ